MVVAELRKYRSEQQLHSLALGRGRVKDDNNLILSTWHGEIGRPSRCPKIGAPRIEERDAARAAPRSRYISSSPRGWMWRVSLTGASATPSRQSR